MKLETDHLYYTLEKAPWRDSSGLVICTWAYIEELSDGAKLCGVIELAWHGLTISSENRRAFGPDERLITWSALKDEVRSVAATEYGERYFTELRIAAANTTCASMGYRVENTFDFKPHELYYTNWRPVWNGRCDPMIYTWVVEPRKLELTAPNRCRPSDVTFAPLLWDLDEWVVSDRTLGCKKDHSAGIPLPFCQFAVQIAGLEISEYS